MFASLQDLLGSPVLEARVVDLAQKKIATRIKEAASASKQDGTAKREAALIKSIDNITTALSKVGWSDALGAKLQADEAALITLRAEQANQRPWERDHPNATPCHGGRCAQELARAPLSGSGPRP
jgi:uncharacterized protein (UPF0210 family)